MIGPRRLHWSLRFALAVDNPTLYAHTVDIHRMIHRIIEIHIQNEVLQADKYSYLTPEAERACGCGLRAAARILDYTVQRTQVGTQGLRGCRTRVPCDCRVSRYLNGRVL